MSMEAEIGMNRTGIATSPRLSEEMLQGMDEFGPTVTEDGEAIARERTRYARSAEPLGHVPPPTSMKGIAKTALQALKGEEPTLFLDKIGERLGFERTGTRLWEAVLTKLDALGTYSGGPTRAELEEIVDEEYNHFVMLKQAATKLGADPTVVTPSADLQATISRGVLESVVDARTNLAQCLEAALVAELADNDSWQALLDLARQASDEQLIESFSQALVDEDKHLRLVRHWIAAAQGRRV